MYNVVGSQEVAIMGNITAINCFQHMLNYEAPHNGEEIIKDFFRKKC